ncbi:MAG: biotin--[acetyl-CoA-carboxylase] ligase [Candidatus Zixiibacteriota bacterium]
MTKEHLNQNLQRLIGLEMINTVQHYEEIHSTNGLAMDLIEKEDRSDGILIIADRQLMGRGRMSKKWHSPEGGIYFSLIIEKIFPTWFALIAALSILRALKMQRCADTTIKWPNDILLYDKKLAGILIQTKNDMTVLGIGINTFDKEMINIDTATSIGPLSMDNKFDIIERTIINLKEMLDEIHETGFPAQKKRLKENMAFLDKDIIIQNGDKEQEGKFIDLSDDGAIVLDICGQKKAIITGSLIPKEA